MQIESYVTQFSLVDYLLLFIADNPCFKRLLGNQPPAILVHGAPQTIDMGIPAPDCDENGFFKPRQCDSSSCWCVDKSGNEFEHTRGNANDIVCE